MTRASRKASRCLGSSNKQGDHEPCVGNKREPEEGLEERSWDEGRNDARHGEADGHVFPHHRPFHKIARGDFRPSLNRADLISPARQVAIIVSVALLFAGMLAGFFDR